VEAPTERLKVATLVLDVRHKELGPPEEGALRRFVAAVLALSDDPRPNIERYLAASRELERSRFRGRVPRESQTDDRGVNCRSSWCPSSTRP
jgi:hypothetical protein